MVVDDEWGPRQWLRNRVMTLAFLGFLTYPLLALRGRPAATVALALAGLAAWAACYARVVWRATPNPHRLSAPYALALSTGTVRNYLSAAIGKTGARNRTEAAVIADERGWL